MLNVKKRHDEQWENMIESVQDVDVATKEKCMKKKMEGKSSAFSFKGILRPFQLLPLPWVSKISIAFIAIVLPFSHPPPSEVTHPCIVVPSKPTERDGKREAVINQMFQVAVP